MQTTAQTIVQFSKKSTLKDWFIVNDGVMGGLSRGKFQLNDDGYGRFYGTVSLENNGGFASLRHELKPFPATANQSIKIHVKGDGKVYQFRVKHDSRAYYSYITTFKTTGDWQEIILTLADFYPSFRGRKLREPNYNHDTITELTFLIGNKKAETFELLIDKIELVN